MPVVSEDQDAFFMAEAIREARKARKKGEVPVGAVLVGNGKILSRGHNGPIGRSDPTAHAEIRAIRRAAKILDNYRLTGCRLYVTLEPCLMCAGAMIQARISEVVFGATDEKNGAILSRVETLAFPWLNHSVSYRHGIREEECRQLLQDFFRERRRLARQEKERRDSVGKGESAFLSGKSEEHMVKK